MNIHHTYEGGELISLIKQNDHYAYNHLYDKYAPALYSVILQIVKDKETANKVVKEVFIQVWRQIGDYDPAKERLFTWVLKMARHAAINETKTGLHLQHLHEQPANRAEMLQSIARSETDDCGFKKLICKLKEEQKMLIDLCYFKNYSEDQIARTMGIPPETVKKRIRVALSALRTMLP